MGADGVRGGVEQGFREGDGGFGVVERHALFGVDALCAVGAEQRGGEVQGHVVVAGVDRDRAVAGAAKASQQRAFGADGGVAGGVIDRGEQRDHVVARGEAFDADRALRGGWQPGGGVKGGANRGNIEAFEPCCGEQGDIGFTAFEFAESRGDIAAKRHHGQIGADVKHLRGASGRAGADAGASGNRGEAVGADQHIAHIGAGQHGGDGQFGRAQRFDIFHRMDGGVDRAFGQPEVEFLCPQGFAADFGQGAVEDPVAAGDHRDQVHRADRPAVRGAQTRARFFGLGQGERGLPGAKAQGPDWQGCGAKSIAGRRRGWTGHAPLAVPAILSKGKLPMALILGIESSCDETAVAVIDTSGTTLEARVVAQRIASQDAAHRPYGGVVPEIAARAHVEVLAPMVSATLADAGIELDAIDAIAATAGPGLIGGVMVGLVTGKALAMAAGKPLIAVNHLEGHALSPRLADPSLEYPYLLLLVSGGHCQILEVLGLGRYRRLATTIDDALGEAFDKTAKILGLGYPGGPAVERLAREGDPRGVPLPRPLLGSAEPHFSFAGLKSAVMRAHEADRYDAADIAASFQQAAIDCLVDRLRRALDVSAPVTALVVAGGVAANWAIRTALEDLAASVDLPLVAPPPRLCTDNAAMIGWVGAERYAAGLFDSLDFVARPRWPLDADAAPVRGAGVKA